MKLIKCNHCRRFFTIEVPGTMMCNCGHSFFRVVSTKKILDKKTGKLHSTIKDVMVWGECTVWYISDKALRETTEGGIVQMQWIREPNPFIKRVDKGTILFHKESKDD